MGVAVHRKHTMNTVMHSTFARVMVVMKNPEVVAAAVLIEITVEGIVEAPVAAALVTIEGEAVVNILTLPPLWQKSYQPCHPVYQSQRMVVD